MTLQSPGHGRVCIDADDLWVRISSAETSNLRLLSAHPFCEAIR
jgi:hypothetical protein